MPRGISTMKLKSEVCWPPSAAGCSGTWCHGESGRYVSVMWSASEVNVALKLLVPYLPPAWTVYGAVASAGLPLSMGWPYGTHVRASCCW